jgi:hypothetical protein
MNCNISDSSCRRCVSFQILQKGVERDLRAFRMDLNALFSV